MEVNITLTLKYRFALVGKKGVVKSFEQQDKYGKWCKERDPENLENGRKYLQTTQQLRVNTQNI